MRHSVKQLFRDDGYNVIRLLNTDLNQQKKFNKLVKEPHE